MSKGIGLLEEFDKEAFAEAQARYEERRRLDPEFAKAEDERIAAEKLYSEALELGYEEISKRNEKAARDAEWQPHYDNIDRLMTEMLKDELAIEIERAKPTTRDKRVFREFRAYCDERGYKALPADPQPVLAYLIRRVSPRGAAHVARARRSIAKVHRALGYPDPCDDLAVKALIRNLTRKETDNASL
ncbi:MAG: hypothetical protein C5B58_13685 [Acidobacteria bacterium]|nr:MAG: hypothetical protein C5B58_13685 [Acidobacteriota bacterium]